MHLTFPFDRFTSVSGLKNMCRPLKILAKTPIECKYNRKNTICGLLTTFSEYEWQVEDSHVAKLAAAARPRAAYVQRSA